jgi:tetratricopeptide (TPR) repeat protein
VPRRVGLIVFVALAGLALPHAAPAAPTDDPNARILRVERWLKAVLSHQPGQKDDAVSELAAWSNTDLLTLGADERVLVELMRNPAAKQLKVPIPASGGRPLVAYTPWQLHRLRVLGCAGGGLVSGRDCRDLNAPDEIDARLSQLARLAARSQALGDNSYVLRRGALLHGDVAMSADALGWASADAGNGGQLRIAVEDGRETSLRVGALHWEIARALLDAVRPGPDEMVRRWYVATGGWMQSREQHDTVHLTHARQLFPDDAEVLFWSGCQQEIYASPMIQAVLRSAVLPTGYHVDVPQQGPALVDAEAFFRQALTASPGLAEGHLRLGHVLLAAGKIQEAADELRGVAPTADEPFLRYFTALFLGTAEEGLGRFDAAREQYMRAAALYPGAQSPYLALSALATRRGDQAEARNEMRRVFDLPTDLRVRNDPWWTYNVFQARNVEVLFKRLHELFPVPEP